MNTVFAKWLFYCLVGGGSIATCLAAGLADESLPIDLSQPSGKLRVGNQTIEWVKVPLPEPDQIRQADDLLRNGKADEAESILRALLAKREEASGKDSPALVVLLRGIGTACWVQGKLREAQVNLQRAIDLQLAQKKGPTEALAYDMRVLGQTYLGEQRVSDAQEMFALGLYAVDQAESDDAKPLELRLELIDLLAGTLEQEGKWAKAEPLLKRLYELQTKYREPLKIADKTRVDTLRRLAQVQLAQLDQAAASHYLKQADMLEQSHK